MQRDSEDTVQQGASAAMHLCLQECQRCHNICLSTLTHCLQMGGRHAEASHIRLLLDCAEICETNANFMLRGSPAHTRTSAVCAEVCDQCAQSCERLGDDLVMTDCAAACRRCADTCREMDSLGM